MIYVLYFTSQGAPKTGLTPSIITYKKVSDNSDVASPPSVSEIGGGGYKFTAVATEPYFVVVDGGATLVNAERYKVMQLTANDGALDTAVSSRAPETGGNVAAIKAKTDNLPADPASNTVEDSITVAHAMQAILAACVGKSNGGGSTTIHFRDQADSKNRITATVDANGDRTAITLSYD